MNATIVRNDADLNNVFESVREEMKLKAVTGKFGALKDFKVRWIREGTESFQFTVSDYLKGAPTEVIEDFAKGLISKILLPRGENDVTFGDAFSEYVTNPQFVKDNQKTYIRRSRSFIPLSESSELFNKVDRVYKSLANAGLVEYDDNVKFIVGKEELGKMGVTVLLKVVELCPTMIDYTDRELGASLIKQLITVNQRYPYNYKEIADDVDDAKMRFNSMSDEEVFGA